MTPEIDIKHLQTKMDRRHFLLAAGALFSGLLLSRYQGLLRAAGRRTPGPTGLKEARHYKVTSDLAG